MAGTRKTQDKDVISKLADAGEDALRRLVDIPRRIVGGTMAGVRERLGDVATKLRAIDPLDGRVGAIERRLDSLEHPKKTTARTTSTRAKPPRASTPGTAKAPEPKQSQHDLERADDAREGHEREQDEARGKGDTLGSPPSPA
jgi:hypothetical protein